MFGNQYPVMDVEQAYGSLDDLHRQITKELGRVVLSRKGSAARCVLISLDELNALERAVDILSAGMDAALMRAELVRVAAEV